MGNVNGSENDGDDLSVRSDGDADVHGDSAPYSRPVGRVVSSDSMDNNTPPESPGRSRAPVMFSPQAPVAPLQRGESSPFIDQMWLNESDSVVDQPPEQGIPTIITWNYGGSSVAVEGSWDNWTSRRILQRSGKDHSVLLVLPRGVYHYKFIVDGEHRYVPDLPFTADEMGHVINIVDVHDYVPDNLESVVEFEAPQSPVSSYGRVFPVDEDFAKEPAAVPSQLHLTVLGMVAPETVPPPKPPHVVLDHLFIEKGWTCQSVIAMGLTHRFRSKFVTVVLYKPLTR